jgi:hypothetical protein
LFRGRCIETNVVSDPFARNDCFSCSKVLSLSKYDNTLEDTWDLGARGIKARGLSDCVEGSWRESETTQENMQDWLELDEGNRRFQLLTEEKIAAMYALFIFISTTYITKLYIYFF